MIDSHMSLREVREKYGENSFEYEYMRDEGGLNFYQYVSLASKTTAEFKKQGYKNADMTAQDYLNDYIEEVDMSPSPKDLDKIMEYIKIRENP